MAVLQKIPQAPHGLSIAYFSVYQTAAKHRTNLKTHKFKADCTVYSESSSCNIQQNVGHEYVVGCGEPPLEAVDEYL